MLIEVFSSATTGGTAPLLKSLLKKPSKVLTVGVEYSPDQSPADEVLSMKLRQQAKVSFVVCPGVPPGHFVFFSDVMFRISCIVGIPVRLDVMAFCIISRSSSTLIVA